MCTLNYKLTYGVNASNRVKPLLNYPDQPKASRLEGQMCAFSPFPAVQGSSPLRRPGVSSNSVLCKTSHEV